MAVGVDNDDVLWICEKLVPVSRRIREGVAELPGTDFPAAGYRVPGVGWFITVRSDTAEDSEQA
jgi:hypothetical protein